MSSEMSASIPKLILPGLGAIIRNDNLDFYGKCDETGRDMATRFVQAAKNAVPVVCGFPENQGKNGVVVAITKREVGFPILTIQIGEVNDPDSSYKNDGKRGKYSDLADRKAIVLQLNKDFVASSQNATLPLGRRMLSESGIEIPGGAIAVGEWIISTSAFKNPKMDTVTSVAIAMGMGLIGIDQAEDIVHNPRVGCVNEFMLNEDKILQPILH